MADRAVPILSYHPNNEIRYALNEQALRRILEHDDFEGLPIMVFSVAGLARKGKSFLLNFVVSFLEHLERGFDEPWNLFATRLDAFAFSPGMERVTVGIHMWNRPFIITHPNGERVGVIVMDTQGTFDRHARHAEGASIFALSTLISSVQVYNIMREVNESDLQYLSLFSAFARAVENDNDAEPFQKLMLLLRDWSYPRQYAFGTDGGTDYINHVLEINDNLQQEHVQLRNDLREVFEKISGFNMPRPGLNVEEDGDEDINLNDLNPNFVNHLRQFLKETFSQDNMVKKKIGFHQIHSDHLFRRIRRWAELFEGDDLPALHNIYQHTMRADDEMAEERALQGFSRNLHEYIQRNVNWDADIIDLRNFFEIERDHAHHVFLGAPGLGNARERRSVQIDSFDRRLLQEFIRIMESAMRHRPANQSPNVEPDVLQKVIKIATLVAPVIGMLLFRRPF